MDSTILTTLGPLLGVVIGAIATGLGGYIKQQAQFRHEREMRRLDTPSAEQVKLILKEMLEHRVHVERSFRALRAPIGGYSDEQIRQFLHEVGARRFEREGSEWWYLGSRQEQHFERRRVRRNRGRRTKGAE